MMNGRKGRWGAGGAARGSQGFGRGGGGGGMAACRWDGQSGGQDRTGKGEGEGAVPSPVAQGPLVVANSLRAGLSSVSMSRLAPKPPVARITMSAARVPSASAPFSEASEAAAPRRL